ncbi:NAD(P)-binding protein [Jonesia denitrificans]|uniref:NAD(P)-binding protein n=1 Tax=Jonesia denitrificans TaxID=43674 RepID=UPI001D0274CF|nr:NAD(P)-binding protein [Jonesia denitrificans]
MRSATEHHTAVVVGGGQSGLATAYYLRRYEVDFLILDNQEVPGGAWLHAWPSLTLFPPRSFPTCPAGLCRSTRGIRRHAMSSTI